MQVVAAEMNLSETAFLLEQDDGFRLRWFTPKVEVDLCSRAAPIHDERSKVGGGASKPAVSVPGPASETPSRSFLQAR